MKQFRTLNNLSKLIVILAWIEVFLAIILTIYTYKNSQIVGEALNILLYGLAGFVFVFAFGKILALLVDIRMHQEQIYVNLPIDNYARREQMINKLHNLMEKQKNSMLRRKYKDSIISILNVLIQSRQDAIEMIDIYRNKFSKKLTIELEGLTSSYELKKQYLKKFIDFKLVEVEYPHKLVKSEVDRE